MNLGIVPDGILERIALASGLLPTPLVTVTWGMGLSRIVVAAVNLGVFDALADGERSDQEIAEAAGTDPHGTRMLLHALNGFGLLRRRGDRFRLAPEARRWLVSGGKRSMVDAVRFVGLLWEPFTGLEDVVRRGVTQDFHRSGRPPEFWRAYMRGLASFARIASGEIARRAPLGQPPRSLLDVAGGHGMYAAGFCGRFPGLRATVLDLPDAADHGEVLVAEAGLADRISYVRGDLREVDWGREHDVVLLFNILHNLSEADGRRALERARAALRPGGTVVVLDSQHAAAGGDLSAAAGFNELMFFLINGTRALPEETMRGFLSGAGFTRLKSRRLLTVPLAVMLTGRAP